ncbi:S-adenosyl-L-methionine-dependent methyltransferase [Polychytrium aggregatum]|uniref:S-adenosyl-L-methionine-dependent methyltransferase n=1 Tax=Polychytrium aggregatum TaxID=110093 RepID=UPI0022FF033C|nr:S-adenosyl-L-methionine-dependent methyltransferase [Polychytrium aggregatum]KAI9208142.1 S-adenosyl-L-methionine-dependent methyltransferase [Polychytrium aggregatum]
MLAKALPFLRTQPALRTGPLHTASLAWTIAALRPSCRLMSSVASAPSTQMVFDRSVKKLQRDRSAVAKDARTVDYLKDEVAARVVDRLLDIKRNYKSIVDLGSGAGHIVKHLESDMTEEVIMTDMSEKLLYRDQDLDAEREVTIKRQIVDEELLPFEENSVECILSSLSLHWVNDLPGSLIQIRRSLKPDSVFIGAIFGEDTLYELRTSLQLAEIERVGGISPHVSPMATVRDIGSLLSRAGLVLTTVDIDEIVINYPSMFELIEDLQTMGESSALLARHHLGKDTLAAASAIYRSVYGDQDGAVPATFQVIYMIGWKEDPSQPKPLPRGSAEVSFKSLETLGASSCSKHSHADKTSSGSGEQQP